MQATSFLSLAIAAIVGAVVGIGAVLALLRRRQPPEPEFLVEYADKFGEVTEREITVLRRNGKNHIVAFCHLRGAERTFRTDRFLSIRDLRTGEVHTGDQDL